MKARNAFAVAVCLTVVTLGGCDAVGTNDSPSFQETQAAPQIELSREIPTNVKTLPSDEPAFYPTEGDTTGNE